jgi:hypothetical protein
MKAAAGYYRLSGCNAKQKTFLVLSTLFFVVAVICRRVVLIKDYRHPRLNPMKTRQRDQQQAQRTKHKEQGPTIALPQRRP